MDKKSILKTSLLSKTYFTGETSFKVLKSVSLEILEGELTFIIGASGSGKSTLLQLMGGLDSATSGHLTICGQQLDKMSDQELSSFRRKNMGFVFQFFNLLNNLNAIENVALPLLLDAWNWKEARQRSKDLLSEFGLKDRLTHYPYQLSGGQMQRVAVCRSLAAKPSIILADEPTGNLDSKTAKEILDLFHQLAFDKGHTIVMVTHDLSVMEYGHRVIKIKDGEIEEDKRRIEQ